MLERERGDRWEVNGSQTVREKKEIKMAKENERNRGRSMSEIEMDKDTKTERGEEMESIEIN